MCVWSALLGLAWLEPRPLACFPSPPPSCSASVDSGRDGQPWFRISCSGRSGVLKREQLYPEVDAEGSGLRSAPWGPRPSGLSFQRQLQKCFAWSEPGGLALKPFRKLYTCSGGHTRWGSGPGAPFTAWRGGHGVREGGPPVPPGTRCSRVSTGRGQDVWFPAHFSLHRPHPPQPPQIKMKIF